MKASGIKLLLGVLLYSLLSKGSYCDGAHIQPYVNPTDSSGENYVDVSGLGPGLDFLKYDSLDIQLMPDLPVWTVNNLYMDDNLFVGYSDDQNIRCTLYQHMEEDGDDDSSFVLGSVHDVNGELWYFINRNAKGDQVVVMKYEEDFPDEDDPLSEDKEVEESVGVLPPLISDQNQTPTTIKVLLIWTAAAECRASEMDPGCTLTNTTSTTIAAKIDAVMKETNMVYSNSGTGVTFIWERFRDTSGYVETGSPGTSLDRLREDCDGFLDQVHPLRISTNSNLVSLVSAEGCGVAIRPPTNVSPTRPSRGFSQLNVDCISLERYTTAHEFGHNFGCRHDRATEADRRNDNTFCTRTDLTNFGYKESTHRTVMAYRCNERRDPCNLNIGSNCPRIPYLSGPATDQMGRNLGGTQNTCRAQIINAAPAIARYNGLQVERRGMCRGDCDTDADCHGELICFQRRGGEAVPGCIGGEQDTSTNDYCTALPTFSADDLKQFFRRVDEELRLNNICGAAYAFRGPGMTEPIMRGFGRTSSNVSSDPVDLDTAFYMASVSKPVTGTAVGVLVDQGKINLDDDICNLLGGPTNSEGKTNTACRNPAFPDVKVTWRMIGTHRSSINQNIPDLMGSNTTVVYAPTGVNVMLHKVVGNPKCPLDDQQQFWEDLFVEKEKIETTIGQADFPVNFFKLLESQLGKGGAWNNTYQPGGENKYSNIAVGYVTSLVERASNATFTDFFKKNIFEPLGMNHTAWFRRDLPNGTKEAMPVFPTKSPGMFVDTGFYCFANYAVGQLHTTIRDMSAYADALLDYGIGKLWSRQTALNNVFGCQEEDTNGTRLPDDECDYSLFWENWGSDVKDRYPSLENAEDMFKLDFTNAIAHSGGQPGVSTDMVVLPKSNAYAILFTNTNDANSTNLTNVMLQAGFDLLKKTIYGAGTGAGDGGARPGPFSPFPQD